MSTNLLTNSRRAALAALLALGVGWTDAPQGRVAAQGARAGGAAPQGTAFPGGRMADDGSLLAAGPSSALFSQEAYTEYALLAPGTAQFAITYFLESTRAGATTIQNATRAGSEGTDISVFDPRTGQPLKFTYDEQPNGDHAINATLAQPIPEGGIGRVLIYKTYKDARTYQVNGDNLVWVRSLAGYRLGVVLPKGYAFTSSNIAAQLSTTADGRLKLAFASPSGQANNLTIHARKTAAQFQPSAFTDMFYDDIKTLYTLDAPETKRVAVEQTYSDPRKGASLSLGALDYMTLAELNVIDLDTAKPLTVTGTSVKLEVPITNDKQSAHLRVTGVLTDGYGVDKNGDLLFTRTMKGLRNTVILPAGYEVSAVSQSATLGRTRDGKAFVALVNLNGENSYTVTIRARK